MRMNQAMDRRMSWTIYLHITICIDQKIRSRIWTYGIEQAVLFISVVLNATGRDESILVLFFNECCE